MENPHLFLTVFAAILGANLLTVAFVWGLREYSRHEDEGTAGSRDSHSAFIGVMMPLAFCGLSLYAIFF